MGGAGQLGGCWSSKCCFCVPGCAYACFPCGDNCIYICSCPGPNLLGCRLDDTTFVGRKLWLIKVVNENKMYANPCCCHTDSDDGACMVWTRSPAQVHPR